MGTTYRCWTLPKAGSFQKLTLTTRSIPSSLEPTQVRIRVKAIGLNFADVFAITGLYSATPSGAFTPGLEFAGEVIECGAEVSHLKPGDRVMGLTRFGAFSELVDVAENQCSLLPEGWSWSQGAAFLVQALTAWYALYELGNLKPGQQVLVHSAAGGVGLQALNMISRAKANPIVCVGNQQKLDWLKEQGYSDGLLRDQQHFRRELDRVLDGRPLHLVLDGIGGVIQRHSFDALAPTGRLVTFGAAQYTPGKNKPRWLKTLWLYLTRPRYDALSMISDNKSVCGFNLIWLWQHIELFQQMFEQLEQMSLPAPLVSAEYDFEQMPAALQWLRSGQSIGKVVVTVPDEFSV
ncbi:medium chain dehydrogenase/reductase family protein [Pleionea sp. CnH1-48]|uniref:synaptic vesicle VAT-1 family membrane protein n=1 Tax=Pleionea sp. CnH1-48 TaxID=2954494 RepID=UPI00209830B2|nr:medium chain dehydrogenase/reductase family protein [Pleionea sp. CnH1-48]MCO7226800.1 medium chain dehydrogenase/reductase family protein [Pleionea sp. CnH1-48]